MRVEDVDQNLKVDKKIDRTGLVFYNFEDEPFKLYGGMKREADGRFHRVPSEVAEATSPGVVTLHTHTTGGRLRFKTDSKRVAIIAKYADTYKGPHFAATGSVGIDVYEGKQYLGSFVPAYNMPSLAYESLVNLPKKEGVRELTMNLPTYSTLLELYVGIDEGASLMAADPYTHEKPVVYYGSSITQGGCSARPGTTYQAFLSRWLDTDYINLGFSGSAKGEDPMVDYLASLDMSVFVCDYDHNAPSFAHLEATHLPLYRKVRAAHPDIPIILLTRPNDILRPETRLPRKEIIKKTYDTAVAEGDKNVYFYDTTEFFPFDCDEHTVDSAHPTDLGFYFMAKGLYPILDKLLNNK